MWERLRRFRHLPSRTRILFLRAAVLLPAISRKLRREGFVATQRWLERRLPPGHKPPLDRDAFVLSVTRAVGAASRHGIGNTTCLQQSLAMWYLLAREGVAADLRIGVRKNGDAFEAHAWIEIEGKALAEPEGSHKHYAAFDADLTQFTVEQP